LDIEETLHDAILLIEYYFALFITLKRASKFTGTAKTYKEKELALFKQNISSLPAPLKSLASACLKPSPDIKSWKELQKLKE